MATFTLKYEKEAGYDQQVTLDIRLKVKPSSEDHQAILDTIEELDKFAQKYLTDKKPPVVVRSFS